jgi:hypothetical protein
MQAEGKKPNAVSLPQTGERKLRFHSAHAPPIKSPHVSPPARPPRTIV